MDELSMRRAAALISVGAALVGVTSCDDLVGLPWVSEPEIARVYTISNPVPNLPSAFDFVGRQAVRIEAPEATGNWDTAFDSNGLDFSILPPGAIGLPEAEVGIARIDDVSFSDVIVAPADQELYATDRPVALELGVVYVVRSREGVGPLGESCSWFAKLEPIELNHSSGFVRFAYDTNPNCGDPALVPPV